MEDEPEKEVIDKKKKGLFRMGKGIPRIIIYKMNQIGKLQIQGLRFP